ncbi:hypothetical protein WOLCODRAFT_128800 [Wolfiporia cocos MD-104 SS10]|uniref:Peptidase C14 caspase domain-containing protein n=1 Tax=Wolfiporia cocos (strain MD-104) TaxID=742152 RepID=A0A2H3JBF2_WOLCO|nr:hypothetical protein WOLCODRAFT_128800 [Wolfiporia cocos MD-104 SS10]
MPKVRRFLSKLFGRREKSSTKASNSRPVSTATPHFSESGTPASVTLAQPSDVAQKAEQIPPITVLEPLDLPTGPVLEPQIPEVSVPSTDEKSESEVSQPVSIHAKSRVYAVVAAIDDYWNPDIPNLSGCVHDGENVVSFLTEVLQVPFGHIVFLRNEAATRDAIIQSIQTHLIHNSDISIGDTMIFYFAGHGARVQAPPGWLADRNSVETICPHDDGKRLDTEQVIYGIPDRTFDGLMRRLAYEKGDNITVIMDTCHSTTALRGVGTARHIPLNVSPSPLPFELDKEIWMWGLSSRTATAMVPTRFLYKPMSSHVILAACRSEEVAVELNTGDEPRGAFTSALLDTLRDCPLGHVTYTRLMALLPRLSFQHPQCEGINKDRVLFNACVVQDWADSFKVEQDDAGFVVEAGSIHGVIHGTEFLVKPPPQVSRQNPDQVVEVRLVAIRVFALRCTATPVLEDRDVHIAAGSRATISNWNARILQVQFHLPTSNHFSSVSSRQHCDVSVLYNSRKGLQLQRSDPLTARHAKRIIDIGQNGVADVLEAVSHFNFHLYRVNKSSPINNEFRLELRRLQKAQDTFNPSYLPAGEDLLAVQPEPLLLPGGTSYDIATIKEAVVTDMDPFYGLTLVNNSDQDLYPYVFYFDPSDYSIQAWYLPPLTTMTAPLPRKTNGQPSRIPIGYGSSETESIKFSLPKGAASDSGFLKVFVSTAYVDMSAVRQQSVLEEPTRRTRGAMVPFFQTWDSWTYVLTCCKPPS